MTDTVVLNTSNSIVTTNEATSVVTNSNTEILVAPIEVSSLIITSSVGNIVVENNISSVLVAGQVGPKGADGLSEEDMVYSKRIDFVTESELYRGEAVVGSSEASSVWRIRKVTIAGDSDIVETWASGNANFDKVWADRATLIYS